MHKVLAIVATLLGVSTLGAQTFDMAAAEKWSAARVVKYRVEGVHRARVPVVFGDYEGKADVTDRIALEFTWDVGAAKVVGAVTRLDGKSEVINIKSDGTNCPPPQLNGPYEHFQSALGSMDGDLIEAKGVRTYPAANVSNYPGGCSTTLLK